MTTPLETFEWLKLRGHRLSGTVFHGPCTFDTHVVLLIEEERKKDRGTCSLVACVQDIPHYQMKTLILIPAFNEEEAIDGCIKSLLDNYDYDILVVNDGSTDETLKIVSALSSHHPRVKFISLICNVGIGGAIQAGFLYATRHNYCMTVQFDGDGQHDVNSLAGIISYAEVNQLDLCIGSRFCNLETDNFLSTPLRRLGIRFFAALIGMLTGTRVTDPTSGYRVYSKAATQLFSRYYPDDYPEPEALFFCVRNGLNVGEFPVRMHERQGGISSIRYFKTLYYMIKVTVAILIDRLRRKEVQ